MRNQRVIPWAIFSILALVAFFVLASGVGRILDLRMAGNNSRVETDKTINISDNIQTTSDPLITPGEHFLLRATDPVWGESTARLTIIEFGDFQCAYCAQMQGVLAEVLPEYGNRIKLIWKDFPNPIHAEARNASLAARCADKQGKFWQYHDYLFVNQASLEREFYNKIALELSLDLAVFNKCLDNKETINLVTEGLGDGQAFGVDATPYLIIGNEVYNYALSADELRQVLDRQLNL
ncbi:MAG TPA: thioredoxin domain-containing protein [bacterium]|mgnify:CR=1 FL=1|nr:thioredoxin domain-containing protein [bacterium]